jgi:hypothetical protein
MDPWLVKGPVAGTSWMSNIMGHHVPSHCTEEEGIYDGTC